MKNRKPKGTEYILLRQIGEHCTAYLVDDKLKNPIYQSSRSSSIKNSRIRAIEAVLNGSKFSDFPNRYKILDLTNHPVKLSSVDQKYYFNWGSNGNEVIHSNRD